MRSNDTECEPDGPRADRPLPDRPLPDRPLEDWLDYELDPALVARTPAEPRDSARLLVFDPRSGRVDHRRVRDLVEELGPGDAMVVNETTVMPARIRAERAGGGRIEGLLLGRTGARSWRALLRNAKSCRPGERLRLVGPHRRGEEDEVLVIEGRVDEAFAVRVEGGASADELLSRLGWTPIPPYILRARRDDDEEIDDDEDRDHYQTVYARPTDAPSVAAPTAGLHFTPELLAALAARGVDRIGVELQVGAGTFKPVEGRLDEHPMHTERCVVSAEARRRIDAACAAARAGRGRVVAIGTTSVRTLESMPEDAPPGDLAWETDLLIRPGYRFRRVDAILTNFHLPRSTLLALVAGFIGLEAMRELYAIAIRERYRFYSYGDAMLLQAPAPSEPAPITSAS